jgi:DNA modification methylase
MANKLILGDNLEILKTLETESIDLIYLDPPFFSNRNYEVIWGDAGEIRSFQDRWAGGISHYIEWLKERVEQMHRILKPTGNIFLHCDWHANAYIRVEILDKIFGIENFRGEITWQRTNAHNDAKKKLAVLKDTVWYYSKTNKNIYNPVFGEMTEKYISEFYKYDDNDGKGKYQTVDMRSPNPRPNLMYEYKGYKPHKNGWCYSLETMQELDAKGLIKFPEDKSGRLRRKMYLSEQKGVLLGDVWVDIQNVQGTSKERIGYPTQKPEKLLQRIIEMSSNEGDTVLDPFVGGGTTVAVADRLNRRWIGIDQSVQAVKVTELRLDKQRDLFSVPFTVQLHKYDYDTLRYKNAFEFEAWIVQQFGGTSNTKQRNDLGLDGKTSDGTPIQVKRSDNIGRNIIDNFFAAIQRYDEKLFNKNVSAGKPAGYIIAFSFGRGAVEEVSRLKLKNNIMIELITVDRIVPIAKKPTLTIEITKSIRTEKEIWEIEFAAKGTSEAGIEFYSWDFEYNSEKGFKASVIIDRNGQQTAKFRAGLHTVAVKVVDNDGLENIEVIRLKVNGTVELSTD